jgi:hypothetical protein
MRTICPRLVLSLAVLAATAARADHDGPLDRGEHGEVHGSVTFPTSC